MKANAHTDELLCGYIDGELSLRQQTEVQRMVARDPAVRQRLGQLQQSRNLVKALPRAEAPGEMLEQIRSTLERRTLLDERPSTAGTRAGSRHLKVRQFLATAAMIALVGVLGGVVYQIVAPVSPPASSGVVATSEDSLPTESVAPVSRDIPAVAVADAGFSGRLELQTASMTQVGGFIHRVIENNGLAAYTEEQDLGDKRVFHVTCSMKGLNRIVADLRKGGQKIQSVALAVDTDRFAEPVVVEPVTLEQMAKIVDRDSAEARVETARDIAVMNVFAQAMPGREIQSITETSRDVGLPSLDIPMPALASDDEATKVIPAPPEGEMNASLTIVLLNTR